MSDDKLYVIREDRVLEGLKMLFNGNEAVLSALDDEDMSKWCTDHFIERHKLYEFIPRDGGETIIGYNLINEEHIDAYMSELATDIVNKALMELVHDGVLEMSWDDTVDDFTFSINEKFNYPSDDE